MKPSNNRSWNHLCIAVLALIVLVLLQGCLGFKKVTPDTESHHLVILGDPHLPGNSLAEKEKVLARINTWDDVKAVVAVGDLCSLYGTEEEYAAAKAYFMQLQKPLLPIAGNHDYIYQTPPDSGGGYIPGSEASQQAKLCLFQETFALSEIFYARRMGRYLLLFLSTDHPSFATGLSERQLRWFRKQLAANRLSPTIVFFHGPLSGTQYNYKHYVNKPHSIAQPERIVQEIIAANPQIFLWVSGHTHTPPTEPSYAAPINLYANQVTNIHNTDMKRETIWTNSLYLHADKVVIKTYNHKEQRWLPELERVVVPPKQKEEQQSQPFIRAPFAPPEPSSP